MVVDSFYTQAVRVFHRKSDNKIVWTFELKCLKGAVGKFPTTIEQDLSEIPDRPALNDNGAVIPDANGKFITLGGTPGDYTCIEVNDGAQAEAILAAKWSENKIKSGKIVIGTKRLG